MTQHVHGHLREALMALPLAWPPNMGPRERKAVIENIVIAVDSLVDAKLAEALQRREVVVREDHPTPSEGDCVSTASVEAPGPAGLYAALAEIRD